MERNTLEKIMIDSIFLTFVGFFLWMTFLVRVVVSATNDAKIGSCFSEHDVEFLYESSHTLCHGWIMLVHEHIVTREKQIN